MNMTSRDQKAEGHSDGHSDGQMQTAMNVSSRDRNEEGRPGQAQRGAPNQKRKKKRQGTEKAKKLRPEDTKRAMARRAMKSSIVASFKSKLATELAALEEKALSASEIRSLFGQFDANEEPKLRDHVRALLSDQKEYIAHLNLMIDFGISKTFSSSSKARILAALFTVDRGYARHYIENRAMFGFGEVLKCIEMLDAPRRIRQKSFNLARLENRLKVNEKAVKKRTLGKLRTEIHQLERDLWPGTSLNGAGVKFFKKWFKKIDKASLEFYLLHFPVAAWRPAFDALHMSPQDLQLEYFQAAIFEETKDGKEGNAIPKDSLVFKARKIARENLAKELKLEPKLANMYSFLRKSLQDDRPERKIFDARVRQLTLMGFDEKHAAATASHFWSRSNSGRNAVQPDELVEWLFTNKSQLTAGSGVIDKREMSDEAKGRFAETMPLDEALWWYHELACPRAEAALQRRLEAGGDAVRRELENGRQSTAYGKLMERMLFFREKKTSFAPLMLPFAEERLRESKLTGSGIRVVVAGDASGSMEVAIKSATILGSLLSLTLDANLVFFNEELLKAPCQPRSAGDVLRVVESMPAKGATSMAAALWPFYEGKIKLDLFVLVSDEGENQKSHGFSFAELFLKYRQDVNPNAQVLLVSFLKDGDRGAVRDSLRAQRIELQQYRLDPDRPDTSKFDTILGRVALACRELKGQHSESPSKTEKTEETKPRPTDRSNIHEPIGTQQVRTKKAAAETSGGPQESFREVQASEIEASGEQDQASEWMQIDSN